jgi:hypothetical protein
MNRSKLFRHSDTFLDSASMIVDYFYVFRPCISPPKDDPPLIIDADRMLTSQIALERLQSIARRDPKVAQSASAVDLDKLAPSDFDEVRREALRRAPFHKDQLGVLAPETADQSDAPQRLCITP